MEKQDSLQFNSLTKSIAQSLQTGFVTFNNQLQIIDFTPPIEKLIKIEDTIVKTLEYGTDPNIWNNWQQLLESVIKTDQLAEFGTVRYMFEGTSRLLNITCVPIKNTSDTVIGGTLILSDITHRLDTEHELAQAERLMAIGKVAGKVAHELNNPLDGIQRYVNLSLRILEQDQPDKAKEYLTHCKTGLQRMAQIISEMLEFSRSTHLAFETSPIDKLLDDSLRALEAPLRNIEVHLVRDCKDPLPHIKSDSLFQVFCNLIKNAADAMNSKGELTITIRQTNTNWQIEFLDSGPGFDPAQTEDLFKPFFTTKQPGRGTGLGLAICNDILEKFNGHILAQNAPDGGGTFTVCLPLTIPQNNTNSQRTTS
jgi:signal transduction histidine kinase